MYKVFFNQKLINIFSQENITLNKSNTQNVENYSTTDVQKWFQSFIKNSTSEVCLIHPNPEFFFGVFTAAFLKIDAAGGIVLNKSKEMLFIYRNGVWDLPKGKAEEGETMEETAIREVEEECGIYRLQIVKKLPSTYHIYQSPYKKTKGKWILKETFWYEMKYFGLNTGIPQEEENITEIKWFASNELDEVLHNTYENLKQIIELYRF